MTFDTPIALQQHLTVSHWKSFALVVQIQIVFATSCTLWQERCTGLQQYADIGGPRLTDAVPLTKKNAVDMAIAFRKRVMQPNAGWDLAETLFRMVSSTRYQPTTSWCLGSDFRYEAAQALFAITLDRAAATKVQTNRIFFNIDGRPQYFMQPEEVEEFS